MGPAEHFQAPATGFITSWCGLWRFLPLLSIPGEAAGPWQRCLSCGSSLLQAPPTALIPVPGLGSTLDGGMGMCKAETQSGTSKGQREGRGGGPSCAWECSWGEERAKLGEGGTGGDTRGEFSSLGVFCGAGCLGKPLEKLWEAAAEQSELSSHH